MSSRVIVGNLYNTSVISREDPYIAEERKRKLAARTEDRAPGKWQDQLMQLCTQHGVRWSQLKVPAKQSQAPAHDTMPLRHKLTLAYTMVIKPEMKWPNLDLSPGRTSGGRDMLLPTLLPCHQIYSINLCRYITGLESLQLHGFPTIDAAHRTQLQELQVSDCMLKDLAGNSFAAPCYMAVLLGLFTHFPAQVLKDRSSLLHNRKAAGAQKEMEKADEFIDAMLG